MVSSTDPAPLPRKLVAVWLTRDPALLVKAGACGTHEPHPF